MEFPPNKGNVRCRATTTLMSKGGNFKDNFETYILSLQFCPISPFLQTQRYPSLVKPVWHPMITGQGLLEHGFYILFVGENSPKLAFDNDCQDN